MAYTNVTGKRVCNPFCKFRGTAYVALKAGDLCALDTSNEGFILADQSSSIAAMCVAIENIAAGKEGWFALACEIEAPDTFSSGIWSAGVLGLAADVCDPLYLAEDGEASDSAGGTFSQVVGFITATNRCVLQPQAAITGTTLSISGNASVGGTFGVTGKATFAEGGGNIAAKGLDISDGGTVTQITSITTGVTLSKTTGQITTDTDPSIAAGAEATFTVTNTLVAATDVVVAAVATQFTDGLVIAAVTAVRAGSFDITLTNVSEAAVTTGAAVINFAVFGGSAT